MVEGVGFGVLVFGLKDLGGWVQGLGFRVPGSGFRVQGSGFRVQGSGFRVPGAGFRVQGSGFRVQDSGFRVLGLGLPGMTPRGSWRLSPRSAIACSGREIGHALPTTSASIAHALHIVLL